MTVAKDSFIQIRVSAEAKRQMLHMAEVEGVSLSELLRRKVLEPSSSEEFGLVRDDAHYGPPPVPMPEVNNLRQAAEEYVYHCAVCRRPLKGPDSKCRFHPGKPSRTLLNP